MQNIVIKDRYGEGVSWGAVIMPDGSVMWDD